MTQSLTTILYVDDEPDIRAIVQMALELTPGLRVRMASSGEEAITDAHSVRPELTLLDVMMPGLDGPGCTHNACPRIGPRGGAWTRDDHCTSISAATTCRSGCPGGIVRRSLPGAGSSLAAEPEHLTISWQERS